VTSDFETLQAIEEKHRSYYMTKKIELCGDDRMVRGFQLFIDKVDGLESEPITLSRIGASDKCSEWYVPLDQYIKHIIISASLDQVFYVQFITNEGETVEMGDRTVGTVTERSDIEMDEFEHLIGAFGRVSMNQDGYYLHTLGFFKNECRVDQQAVADLAAFA